MITGIILIIIGLCFNYKERIYISLNKYLLNNTKEVTLGTKNKYYRAEDFAFVQNTSNFSPNNKQDIYNIYYTVLNAGKKNFTFYCPNKYKDCLTEVKALANNQTMLSNINNFVHPYNSFKHIETEYDSAGKVSIHVIKNYTTKEIEVVSSKVKEIEQTIFNQDLSVYNQVKVIHDYIINNSVYDQQRSDNNVVNYKSDIAYGPLIEGHGLCGGYTDSMALFLIDLNIKNYKIASAKHVWNGILVNDKWYNLDLTWDDPVVNDGRNLLEYNYFLITSEKFKTLNDNQHDFDTSIYQEVA